MSLRLVAICALGLEEFLQEELKALGIAQTKAGRGAVTFQGRWPDVWRTNWQLRTANRVLVELGRWAAPEDDHLYTGARALVEDRTRRWDGLAAGRLFAPDRTIAIHATSTASVVRDTRWVALKTKDGLVDGQRKRFGRRASIDRKRPDLPLRVWLHKDRASLLLDTSGEPLDRRGYRRATGVAPLRETMAAACVLASGWDGRGPVVDPMCGTGTLLAEAAWFALRRPAGWARGAAGTGWAFERFPGFDRAAFAAIQRGTSETDRPDLSLWGIDRSPEAVSAAGENLERAGLADIARVQRGDAFEFKPPNSPGLVILNPPYGERIDEDAAQWRRVGDLLKQSYAGWKAVVLAGGESRGKQIGLRPRRRIAVRNGPLDVRILPFDLYRGTQSGVA
ncbi:MAG: RNA methyltransferase [Acidobacteriota bacterium]